jgi:hypothetical protein
VDNETVFIDLDRQNSDFKDGTGLNLETVKNLMAEIRYSYVLVTSASTLVLDTVANGKQPILYNFDKDKNVTFRNSIKRLYTSLWFKEVLRFCFNNVVNSEEDLLEKIKEMTVFPAKDWDKKQKMLDRLCYKVDGKSGERLFSLIDSFIEKKTICAV